jgi:hypothetical protein
MPPGSSAKSPAPQYSALPRFSLRPFGFQMSYQAALIVFIVGIKDENFIEALKADDLF